MATRGLSKREIEASWKKDERRKHRDKMRTLRKRARCEKKERKRRLRDAKTHCDERVKKAKAKAQAAFEKAGAAALAAQKAETVARNAARDASRRAARDKCALDAAHVKAEAKAKIADVEREKEEERTYQRDFWATERAQRGRKKKANGKRRARERRGESDDLVRQNLTNAKHLLPLWEKMKRRIKADEQRSRTEVFLDWVHDHPEAVFEAQPTAKTDKALAAAERAHWQERRGMVETEDEVPF